MQFTAKLWRHEGADGWHFVTVPADVSDEIRALAEGRHRPFGSLRVAARIGSVEWKTSLFSDTKRDAYLLPVKADVRRRAGVDDGDVLDLDVRLLDV